MVTGEDHLALLGCPDGLSGIFRDPPTVDYG